MALPNPTIVGEFSRTKRLPAAITFTRASAATYTDNNGYVQYAGNNTARFDHTPSDGTSNGLLIEEARTNLLVNSSDHTASQWQIFQRKCISNCAKAPDGTYTADLLVPNSGVTGSAGGQLVTVTAGQTYTFSIWIKGTSGVGGYISPYWYDTADGDQGCKFNPLTGAYFSNFNTITPTANSTTAYPNGWYRLSITFTPASATTFQVGVRHSDWTANGIDGVYAWGAQLELGAFPTSYIPSVETFTSRLSNATYFDSTDGLLKVTPTNLLTYSQDFTQSYWNKPNLQAFSSTGSLANIAISPDGTQTASKIMETAANVIPAVYSGTFSVSAGQVLTYSIYVKAGERTKCGIVAWVDNTHYVYIHPIDLNTGTYTVNAAAGMSTGQYSFQFIDAGYGWKRIVVTLVAPVTTTTGLLEFRIVHADGSASYPGTTTSGLYIWGAQVNLGALQQYTVTTGTAIGDTSTSTFARPHYNPYSKINNGILLEPSATNLLTYSEQFDNAVWTKGSITISANQTTAPDGTLTGDKLVDNATNSQHTIYFIRTGTNETLTWSFFAKAAEITTISFSLTNFSGSGATANVNLLDGSISNVNISGTDYSNIVAYAIPYQNGWYRCCISATKAAVNTNNIAWIGLNNGASYVGTGQGIYLWGAQLETGTSATSYIPTIASQKTRAADTGSSTSATRVAENCYINVGSWFNQSEGTIYTTSQMKNNPAGYPRVAQIEGTTSGINRTLIYYAPGTTLIVTGTTVNGGSGIFDTSTTITSGSSPSTVLAYKTNDMAVSWNGAAPYTDTSAVLISAPVKLAIGCSSDTNYDQLNGTLARFYYWPKRLTNTDIQNLSGL